ncbi:caspase family protein [Pontibacter toksunensis]|uniref:Caspase family protein n=1 Tax=Pontibacter toksunensis TaxID=1332631 RepID=A0ABW6BTG4_9BACT
MASGISLHIGLNAVDPSHYSGWNEILNAAEYDAHDMYLIASAYGYHASKLLGSNATRNNVIHAIQQASATLRSGDIFLLTYSGHGGQLPDFNSEENDGLDETWCLYDGEFLDDELYYLWYHFKDNVRILVISDSCHSGSVVKARGLVNGDINIPYKSKSLPSEIAASTYFNNKAFYDNLISNLEIVKSHQIAANVKLLSACQDNQESKDGAFNGRFTGILKLVLNGGKFRGNYAMLHKTLLMRFSSFPDQSPNLMNIGKQNFSFDNQMPFTI